jgi:hypothetical protein
MVRHGRLPEREPMSAKRTFAEHRRLLSATDMPIAPRKYRARHMHTIVNHGTVGARNEGATRA